MSYHANTIPNRNYGFLPRCRTDFHSSPPKKSERSLASPCDGGRVCGFHTLRETLYRFCLRSLVLRRLAVVLLVLVAPMFGAGEARADVLATNLDTLLIYQDGYFLHSVEVSDYNHEGAPVGIAQKFTAGDHGGGYTLSSVNICLIWISATLSVPKVTIYTADADGNPGTLKYTLSNPASYPIAGYGDDFTNCGNGEIAFTAPSDATLESETDYFVVFENVGTQATEAETYSAYNIGKVLSGAESPSASGWSIADAEHYKNNPTDSWVERTGSLKRPVRLEINGATITDTTVPGLDTATVSGRSLVLTYHENLDGDSEPATSAYSVSVDSGTGAAPSSVAVSGKKVTLTLATAVTNGQTVTVTYTKPASNPVKDKSGNEAAGFTNQSVTNNTSNTNNAPEFSGTSTTRSFIETVGNARVQMAADIGAAVVATDGDSDPLTYTLEGTDAGNFTIVSTSGQIRTKVDKSYDHEAKASYSVTVKADDSRGGTDTIAVTISVTNVAEKPLVPEAPSVSAIAGSTTSLSVGWVAPLNTGRPVITSYDLQYKKTSASGWTEGPQNVMIGTSTSIMELDGNTPYQVQVLATNTDGDSDWSSAGSGRTNPPPNSAPEFSGTSTTRSFIETVGNARVQMAADIGAAVVATDGDSDPLTYTLEGTDAGNFTIVSTSGQIRTKVDKSYDHEAKASYSVTVKADDSRGGTDTIAVTISVTNVAEKPLVPEAPSVSAIAGSTTSLSVGWVAPLNTGRPVITSYDLQYKKTSASGWTEGPQNVMIGTSTSIMELDGNTPYQVQVLATNADGDSDWSSAGSGQTDNSAPVFSDGASATRRFNETVGNARVQMAADIGAAVTATDSDNDSLIYSLGGADAGNFTIDTSDGQIRTKVGESYDREMKASYDVTVTANDGTATTTIPVTISVTDVTEKPLVPEAPTVSATTDSTTELDVSWVAPLNTGRPTITSYDLQYKKTSASGWTEGPQNVAGTSATIGRLTPETEYQVQVLATNADGDSDWSSAGSGQTDALPPSLVFASVTTAGTHVNLSFSRSLSDTLPPASAITVTVDGLDAEFRDDTACEGCPIDLVGPTSIGIAVVNLIRRGQSVRVSYTDPTDGDDTEAIQDERGRDAPSFVDQAVENNSTSEPHRPSEPRNFRVTVRSSSEIELFWDPPADNGGRLITAYGIEYSTDGVVLRPWTELVGNTGNTDTTYKDTGLPEGTTRYYRVLAINSEGASNASNSGHATTPTTDGTPSPPRNLRGKAGKLKVDLSWKAPGDEGSSLVTGYKIEVSTDGGNTWTELVENTGNTNTTYEHTELSAGATYRYRIRAMNDTGPGVVSAVLEATTPPGPSEPRNLRAVPGDRRITLIWDAPEDDQGLEITGYSYRLHYGGVHYNWPPVTRTRDTIKPTDNRFVILGLHNGQTYEIELRAENGNGPGASAITSATPAVPTENPDTGDEAHPDERRALLALYHETGGENWEYSDDWNTPAPVGTWHGVMVDSEGRVTELDLAANGLSGEVPPSLVENLPNLRRLYLNDNRLSAVPLAQFRDLLEGPDSALEELALWGNDLLGGTGNISVELDRRVERAALRALYEGTGGPRWKDSDNWLDETDLFSFSEWYEIMTDDDGRVVELDLSDNGLSGEPGRELEALGSLESLDLSRNPDLEGELPRGLMELSALEVVNIEDTGMCAPGDTEFNQWLAGISFDGEICAEDGDDSPDTDMGTEEHGAGGGGGCAVASGGNGVPFNLLLLIVALVLKLAAPAKLP